MHEQTTTNRPTIQDGDVIEIDGPDGAVTALVLLANAKMVILDLCDDSTPVVHRASTRCAPTASSPTPTSPPSPDGSAARAPARRSAGPRRGPRTGHHRSHGSAVRAGAGTTLPVRQWMSRSVAIRSITSSRSPTVGTSRYSTDPQAAARFPMAREHASSSRYCSTPWHTTRSAGVLGRQREMSACSWP